MRAHRLLAGLATASALLLSACSMQADRQLAEAAIPAFHQQLDAGRFDAIYDVAADDLKRAAPRSDFTRFLAAVHRKLGVTQSSVPRGWQINVQTSGTYVTLTVATVFAGGAAQERFVYRLQDKQARLAGYNINSNALILQ